MFERYTEKARRAIFFARYEASQLGISEINSDLLLLGILRESGHIATRWLGMTADEVKEAVAAITFSGAEKIATNIDLPISHDAKRVLAHAAQEAERAGHQHIGTEHLFLGLLHEYETFAARRMRELGKTLESVRAAVMDEAGKVSIASSGSVPRGQKVVLQLEDGSELATVVWNGQVAAIGESLSVATDSSGGDRYRVVDVRWVVRKPPVGIPFPGNVTRLESVALIVKRELS